MMCVVSSTLQAHRTFWRVKLPTIKLDDFNSQPLLPMWRLRLALVATLHRGGGSGIHAYLPNSQLMCKA